jgi:hypothetical protein
MSFWGYTRCKKNERGVWIPVDIALGSIPDVIIQFSWKNKKGYEEDAINQMMTEGCEKDNLAFTTQSPSQI